MRAYALRNAIEHGEAKAGNVLPKLFNHGLSKDSIKSVMGELNEIVSWVNGLSPEEREREFEVYKDLVKEREVKEKSLPSFLGDVVMRFKPSPSGPLHVGHSYVAALNSEIVQKNDGKFYLWIDDTNPDNIYPGAYDLIPEDIIWLTRGNIAEILLQSDHLPLYYEKFEALLELDHVYICDCDPKKFKDLLGKGKACPCRDLSREEQKMRWKKMFHGYKKGDAVARLKTDLKHKNPAMRDFPLFRINDSSHPRQKKKYRVWPLMNMAVAIDDLKIGSTHVIRAKIMRIMLRGRRLFISILGRKLLRLCLLVRLILKVCRCLRVRLGKILRRASILVGMTLGCQLCWPCEEEDFSRKRWRSMLLRSEFLKSIRL
jgi:glutamyl-tRNA synthetase